MAEHVSKTELNEAAPVESPEEVVRAAIDEVAKPKTSRKAKLQVATSLATEDAAPDYAALGVEEAEVEKYEELRLRFKDLGRRSTAQVFECGEVVHELHKLAPDQVVFTKLAKGVLGLSRTGAENYGRVYVRLAAHRARLVHVAMVASALYDLATAEPEQVEEVLAACEAGQKLTGAQIKAMLGKTSAPSISPDDGGIGGLKARIAQKTMVGVATLMDNAAALFEAALIAAEPHRQGKRIVVKDTQRPFIYPARMIRSQLEWLTWIAVPAPQGYREDAIHHTPLTREDRWHELHTTLDRLGSFESWPAAKDVGPWLNDTVVPQLSWLLGERSKKPLAVVDKLAAAAEAERKKADETKVREQAEAKQAREKAKGKKVVADKRAAREARAAAKRGTMPVSPQGEANPVTPADAGDA